MAPPVTIHTFVNRGVSIHTIINTHHIPPSKGNTTVLIKILPLRYFYSVLSYSINIYLGMRYTLKNKEAVGQYSIGIF